MKRMAVLSVVALVLVLLVGGQDALAARRLGGGKSIGQQSSHVTKRESTSSATPQQSGQQNAVAQRAAPTAQQSTPNRSAWGGILGGLAAGLGLAWLANTLGLGGALANVMGAILMGLAILMLIGLILRRRGASAGAGAYTHKGYSSHNVGNDSAARPFERMNYEAAMPVTPSRGGVSGSIIGAHLGNAASVSSLSTSQSWGIPMDFDTAGFLAAAKTHYVALQAAWDRGDQDKLRSMLTEEMMTEVRTQLSEREVGGAVQHNEVVSLDAQLLGIEQVHASGQYMASVEFSGTVRDEPGVSPIPFREVWNLTKPMGGGGWLVAGIQSLD